MISQQCSQYFFLRPKQNVINRSINGNSTPVHEAGIELHFRITLHYSITGIRNKVFFVLQHLAQFDSQYANTMHSALSPKPGHNFINVPFHEDSILFKALICG